MQGKFESDQRLAKNKQPADYCCIAVYLPEEWRETMKTILNFGRNVCFTSKLWLDRDNLNRNGSCFGMLDRPANCRRPNGPIGLDAAKYSSTPPYG